MKEYTEFWIKENKVTNKDTIKTIERKEKEIIREVKKEMTEKTKSMENDRISKYLDELPIF